MTKLRRKFVVKILDLRRFAVFRGAVCPGECHNGEFRTRANNVKVHIKSSTYSCTWMLITLWAKGELKNHFGEGAMPCLLCEPGVSATIVWIGYHGFRSGRKSGWST